MVIILTHAQRYHHVNYMKKKKVSAQTEKALSCPNYETSKIYIASDLVSSSLKDTHQGERGAICYFGQKKTVLKRRSFLIYRE